MSLSYTTYTGDGSTTDFAIPFGYLEEDHVAVLVDGSPVTFSFHNATTARCASAPANGTTIKVMRTTPIDVEEVEFTGGSTLTSADLERANRQAIYAAQEATDAATDAVGAIESDPTSGLPLPVPGAANRFVVSTNGTDYAAKTVVEVQSLLGIDGALPAAEAATKFLATNPGAAEYQLITASTLKSRLSLPTNVQDADLLGTASTADTGTSAGNVVVLDGSAALPAVSGANLTGVLKSITAARFEHRTGANAAPSPFTLAAWNKRLLSTSVTNGISGASVSTGGGTQGQITLAAGTYQIDIEGSLGYTTDSALDDTDYLGSILKLYNVTDSADVLVSVGFLRTLTSAAFDFKNDRVSGYFTIAGTKVFEVRHWVQVYKLSDGSAGTSTPTVKPGHHVGAAITPNVHTVVNILRIA